MVCVRACVHVLEIAQHTRSFMPPSFILEAQCLRIPLADGRLASCTVLGGSLASCALNPSADASSS